MENSDRAVSACERRRRRGREQAREWKQAWLQRRRRSGHGSRPEYRESAGTDLAAGVGTDRGGAGAAMEASLGTERERRQAWLQRRHQRRHGSRHGYRESAGPDLAAGVGRDIVGAGMGAGMGTERAPAVTWQQALVQPE